LVQRPSVGRATTEEQFDFPHGQANAETFYDGTGTVPDGSPFRASVASPSSPMKATACAFFISGYFTPESRVLLHRNIADHVEREPA